MAYSIEIKNEVKKRLADGEKVKQITEQMGISVPTIYNWKKEFEKQIQEEKEEKHKPSKDEIDTSKNIKKLIRLKQFDKAVELTQKYPYNKVIQSQRISILIKRRKYPEAKRIGKRFIEDPAIQSQMATIAIEEGDFDEAKRIGKKFINNPAIQSQMATIAIEEGDFDEAKRIGKRFIKDPAIQSQMATIAIEGGDFDEAKRIGKKFINNPAIQSQMATIAIEDEKQIQKEKEEKHKLSKDEIDTSKNIKKLIRLKQFDKAMELTQRYPYNKVIQSQRISILIKRRKYPEAKRIGKRFMDYRPIQSQMITIAIEEGDFDEAKRIGKRFIGNPPIQSQMLAIAIEEGDFDEARRIGEKFKGNPIIQTQLKNIETGEKLTEIIEIIEVTENYEKQIEVQEKSESKEDYFMNKIKTKLYYDKIDEKDIDEIRQTDEVSYNKKVFLLLAVYEKTNSLKQAKKLAQEAKENNISDMAKLNMIMERIKSKKTNIFNFGFYDDLLDWKFDKELFQKYQKEKKTEETKEKELVKRESNIDSEELAPKNNRNAIREQKNNTVEVILGANIPKKQKIINLSRNTQKTQTEFRQRIRLENTALITEEAKQNDYTQDVNRIVNCLQQDKAPTYVKIEEAREAWNKIVEAEIKRRKELDKVRQEGKAKKAQILNIYAQDEQLKCIELSKRQAYDQMQKVIERYDKIEELIGHLKESMAIINGKDTEKKQKSEEFLKRICEKFRKLEEKEERLNNGSR